VNVNQVRQILEAVNGRWRVFSTYRLRQFGHTCDTY